MPSAKYCEPFLTVPIVLRPLVERQDELDRIVTEYARDAYMQFGIRRLELLPDDHEWIKQYASSSLADIEKATLRVVALRASGDIKVAATQLGMAYVSLSRWMARRKLALLATNQRRLLKTSAQYVGDHNGRRHRIHKS